MLSRMGLRPEIIRRPSRARNRFPFNNFKFFLLSFQSPFHLSLSVLVRYRSPAAYLALGGVYHPFQAALSSNPTRRGSPSRDPGTRHPPVGVGPYGNVTLYVSHLSM